MSGLATVLYRPRHPTLPYPDPRGQEATSRKRSRGASSTTTETRRRDPMQGVNYNALVRHDDSGLIYRKRKTLARAWNEIDRGRSKVYSKWQCLTTTAPGGADIWWGSTTRGNIACVHGFSNLATNPADLLPMHLFRLSEYPKSKHTSVDTGGTTSVTNVSPHVFYQLAKNSVTTGTIPLSYNFVPNTGQTTTTENNVTLPNAYTILSKDGASVSSDNVDSLASYTHEWSNIKLCFWACDVPTEWTVQIVSMPDKEGHRMDITGDGYVGASTVLQTRIRDGLKFETNRTALTQYRDRLFENVVKHLNGHPNANDRAIGNSFKNPHMWALDKSPFHILKSEKFHVPAAVSTDGTRQKVLKKLFYRAGKHYAGMDNHQINAETATRSGINDYTIEADTDSMSPFAMPGKAVYLLITAKSYTKFTHADGAGPSTTNVGGTNTSGAVYNAYPTYDVCIENCHTHTIDDVADVTKN